MLRRAQYAGSNREVIEAPDGTKIRLRIEVNGRAKRVILRPDLNANEIVAVAPNVALIKSAIQFAQSRASELAKMVRKMSDPELRNRERPEQLNPADRRFEVLGTDGDVLTVRVELNRKAHNVILKIDDMNHEAVAVIPSIKQLDEAKRFATRRVDALLARLDVVPEPAPFVDGGKILFRGETVVLRYDPTLAEARFEDGAEPAIVSPGQGIYFERRIQRFLENEAFKTLLPRIHEYSSKLGVRPPANDNISLKDTKSLWGSCRPCRNSRNPLNPDYRMTFSWRLICAAPEILDYVAAHECSHMREMNHSKKFWRHVENICPDYRRQEFKLKKVSRRLRQVGLNPKPTQETQAPSETLF